INVVGSPLASTSVANASPSIASGEAIAKARLDAGLAVAPVSTDSARPAYFRTVGGTRSAYETIVGAGSQMYQSVVDGQSGRVLYRRSLVNYANGLVLDNYPNAPAGGTFHTVDLNHGGDWLPDKAHTLTGPNVHEYSDI